MSKIEINRGTMQGMRDLLDAFIETSQLALGSFWSIGHTHHSLTLMAHYDRMIVLAVKNGMESLTPDDQWAVTSGLDGNGWLNLTLVHVDGYKTEVMTVTFTESMND
jgi:hypothetical protein